MTERSPLAAHASLSMTFRADWSKIEPLRVSLIGFVHASTGSATGGNLLAMVTAELLEQAIELAAPAEPEWVRLAVTIDGDQVEVHTTRPIDPGGPAYASFRELWNQIQSPASPSLAFRSRLEAVHDGAAGGIGLAHLRNLGCELSHHSDEDGLQVSARFSLGCALAPKKRQTLQASA